MFGYFIYMYAMDFNQIYPHYYLWDAPKTFLFQTNVFFFIITIAYNSSNQINAGNICTVWDYPLGA